MLGHLVFIYELFWGGDIRDFSADEWMLYEFSSPRAAGARGFNFGKIFRKDGQLVVTVAQEAVIRVR